MVQKGTALVQSVWRLATDWRTGFSPRQRQRIFPLASVSRPALRPTQPPIQWVTRVLSSGVKRDREVTLTTHPQLVLRRRMSKSYTYSPPCRLHGSSGTSLLCTLLVVLMGKPEGNNHLEDRGVDGRIGSEE
jgi:hypothetical protein